MIEQDPVIQRIIDPMNRNLLDPGQNELFEVDTSGGRETKFQLQIQNGPQNHIDLEISTDMPWLQPETNVLKLLGAELGACHFKALPTGEEEFANILFSWEGLQRKHQQNVMIRRILPLGRVGFPWLWAILAVVVGVIVGLVGVPIEKVSEFGFIGISIALFGLCTSVTKWLFAVSSTS